MVGSAVEGGGESAVGGGGESDGGECCGRGRGE